MTEARAQTGQRLKGVLERIKFFNEENHFCIAEFRPEKARENVVIVGNLPGVQCGETLELDGEWMRHAEYGEQFRIAGFTSRLPASVHGIRKYLGSGLVPGIGKTYADKIVDHFGEDTLRVISEQSGRLREVEGIGPKRARQIKAAWDEQRAVREVMVFLQTHGVSSARCVKLVRQYGQGARRILENEPYRLASEVDGIGFKTADTIALNLGLANDGARRIDAGVLHILEKMEGDGHTCFPQDELVAQAADLLEVPPEKVRQRAEALLGEGRLMRPLQTGLVQSPAIDRAETSIAESLLRLSRTSGALPAILVDKAVEWAQERAGFPFAKGQQSGIRTALEAKVSILTGGPGTGKTTILRSLVAILKAKKVRVVLAAPTGRAAQRLGESAGMGASTLHRLLKFDPQAGGFTHNAERPVPADFVIVDEASMLDSKLAAVFLRALPNTCHLLLVGDSDQLPSVGAGNVLRDLIQCGQLPVVRLTDIFRQSGRSGIVTTAHDILHGRAQPPVIQERLEDVDPEQDLVFVETGGADACQEQLVRLCRGALPHWYGLDPIRDVQVLAPMHRGAAGIGQLNTALQEALNPDGASFRSGAGRYQVGDKVMQVRNNYDKNLFNGDVGIVTAVNAEAGSLAARFDGHEHEFDRGELNELNVAYAVSVHKAQGSEYPIVVIPLVRQHFVMLQRTLLYTAVTRARKKVFLLGEASAYAIAVRNRDTAMRFTDLDRKLRRMFAS
jgi:exodeoxyribonuclease V alpha subunit